MERKYKLEKNKYKKWIITSHDGKTIVWGNVDVNVVKKQLQDKINKGSIEDLPLIEDVVEDVEEKQEDVELKIIPSIIPGEDSYVININKYKKFILTDQSGDKTIIWGNVSKETILDDLKNKINQNKLPNKPVVDNTLYLNVYDHLIEDASYVEQEILKRPTSSIGTFDNIGLNSPYKYSHHFIFTNSNDRVDDMVKFGKDNDIEVIVYDFIKIFEEDNQQELQLYSGSRERCYLSYVKWVISNIERIKTKIHVFNHPLFFNFNIVRDIISRISQMSISGIRGFSYFMTNDDEEFKNIVNYNKMHPDYIMGFDVNKSLNDNIDNWNTMYKVDSSSENY